jgi:hypothetical protein
MGSVDQSRLWRSVNVTGLKMAAGSRPIGCETLFFFNELGRESTGRKNTSPQPLRENGAIQNEDN